MSGIDFLNDPPSETSAQQDPSATQPGGGDGNGVNAENTIPQFGQEFTTTTEADIIAQTMVTPLDNPSMGGSTYEDFTSTSTSTTFTSESTPTFTPSSSDSQNDNDNDSGDGGGGGGGGGMSNSTKIAIAVPVAIVGAAILAAILFFLLRRRRRQRQLNTQPVISTPQLETSAIFLPAQIQPVPPPPAAPITRRPLPQNDTLSPPGPEAVVVPAAAARDLEWRTSEEHAARPRSPFDHPDDNDDALSFVSGMSDREAMMRARERDDDLSSVSSFEDEPRPTMNRGGG
ncbi:hypothetical protein BDV12DRAFT_159619 [Aspergillus spectabilis]